MILSWTLIPNPRKAKNTVNSKFENDNPIPSMAGSSYYDRKTKSKLRHLLEKPFKQLDGNTLANILKNKTILEVMAGCGRLIPVYKVYKPKSITIVDISGKSIDFAK